MTKTLYIIRGLPGSGKTTLAHRLSPVVFEADDYFTKDNVYTYLKDRLAFAHRSCRENAYAAMKRGEPVIAVSNTFSRLWEYEKYIEMGLNYGYTVQIITVSTPLDDAQLAQRNVHQVPQTSIRIMRERWEP